MAKELPYFKFNAAEWISGPITLEDLNTQGAFINICAFYWFKSGSLTLSEIKRRLKLKQATIDKLVSGNHIKLDGDDVNISFLSQQFEERGHISKRNSENGKKGGAPKGNSNAKIEEKNNREQPKTTNIEREENRIRREEEEREETLPTFGIDISVKKLLNDEKWIHDIRHLTKGKDLEGAARSAYLFLEASPNRFKQSGLNELKKTTLSWLENDKPVYLGQKSNSVNQLERMKNL